MDAARVAAAGSIGVTGIGLVAGAALSYPTAGPGALPALALVALGSLVGAALVAGAVHLHRSEVRTRHAFRVAGWNLLGVVLLGAVLFVATLSPATSLPGFVVVTVLGVSSVAHVLIGYNDVRRIRAEDLATQRRKLAVVNRLARHNIRNETQLLTSYAGQLLDRLTDPGDRQLAENIRDTADELSSLHERLQEFQRAIDEAEPRESVELRPLVESVLAEYRDTYDGTFEVDVPEGLAVTADDHLETALEHLVENAVTHGSTAAPHVTISARDRKGLVTLSVSDRGPGIPREEIEALTGESAESPLEHASGLGLWVVKAIAESYGGDLEIGNRERGATVSLTFEVL